MEKVKIVVELHKGAIQAVYGGAFVDVLLVDHDMMHIEEKPVASMMQFLPEQNLAAYGGMELLEKYGV